MSCKINTKFVVSSICISRFFFVPKTHVVRGHGETLCINTLLHKYKYNILSLIIIAETFGIGCRSCNAFLFQIFGRPCGYHLWSIGNLSRQSVQRTQNHPTISWSHSIGIRLLLASKIFTNIGGQSIVVNNQIQFSLGNVSYFDGTYLGPESLEKSSRPKKDRNQFHEFFLYHPFFSKVI